MKLFIPLLLAVMLVSPLAAEDLKEIDTEGGTEFEAEEPYRAETQMTGNESYDENTGLVNVVPSDSADNLE